MIKQERFISSIFSLLLSALLCTSQAYAEPDSAQHKLDLVKQALIDLSLGSDIKLASTAYIDSAGVLHESSVLKSNVRVRGIRISEYLQEAGMPRAKVDASVLPDDGCENSQPAVKREASVRMIIDTNDPSANRRVGDHYLTELNLQVRRSLVEALTHSGHWVVAPEQNYASSYARYVSASSAETPPYRFDIVLSNRNPLQGVTNHGEIALHHALKSGYDLFAWSLAKIPNLNYSKPWPKEAFNYQLVLYDQATNQILWRGMLPISYPKVARGYAKTPLPIGFKNEIVAATEQFVTAMVDSISCQIGYYRLSPVAENPRQAQINAGSIAGVEVKDQFLIVKDRKLMDQTLAPSGLDALALAEVISVSANRAVLKWKAGSELFGASGDEERIAMLF